MNCVNTSNGHGTAQATCPPCHHVVQGRQLLDENLEGLVLPAALLQQTASALGAPGDQGVRAQAAAMLRAMRKGLDSHQEASSDSTHAGQAAGAGGSAAAAEPVQVPPHRASCVSRWMRGQALPVMFGGGGTVLTSVTPIRTVPLPAVRALAKLLRCRMRAQSTKGPSMCPGQQTSCWPHSNTQRSDLQEAGAQQHGAQAAVQSSGTRASLAVQDRPSLASQVYTRQREDLLEAEREFLTQVTLKMPAQIASCLHVPSP